MAGGNITTQTKTYFHIFDTYCKWEAAAGPRSQTDPPFPLLSGHGSSVLQTGIYCYYYNYNFPRYLCSLRRFHG